MITKVFQATTTQIDTIISFFDKKYFLPLIPYTKARIQVNDCIITIYTSNKVLFQGNDAEKYYNVFFESNVVSPQAGSDEVGTGDLFGPICVCASYIDKTIYEKIKDLKIIDSKQLTDTEILTIAPKLIEICPHSLLLLDNEKFNIVNKTNNLNEIKAKMHNQAYINLSKKITLPKLLVIDDFCGESLYYHYLENEPSIISHITFETKAENKFLAVAISAIISRFAFLKSFEKLNEKYQMNFPKGAGKNTDIFLQEFIRKYPNELEKVAKMSWKNIKNLKN